jgi:hypothetical protein
MALHQGSTPRRRRDVILLLDADGAVTLYGREMWHEIRDDPVLRVRPRSRPGVERDNSASDEERPT